MKIISRFSQCILLCIVSLNTFAAANNDSIKIVSLQKTLDEKDKTIENLNMVIDGLKRENAETTEQLNQEKKNDKVVQYLQIIKRLRKDSLDLANQIVAMEQDAEIANNEELDKLATLHENDTRQIEELQNELEELEEFKGMYLAQMASSVNEKWLSKPYTELDMTDLEREYKQYEKYANVDRNVAEARDKLKPVLANCQLYNKAKDAVNNKYDANKVNALIKPMQALRDKEKDVKNKENLKTVFRQLYSYDATIPIFQDVITAVNKSLVGQEQPKAAFMLAKATIEKMENEDGAITAIKDIPWLAKQFNIYYKALQKNCLTRNPVADEIMAIQIK